MKYILVLGDGMADEPIEEIGGRTPLEAAVIPHVDALARRSEIGMVQTVPAGMAPGSDTANLSVLGYEPQIYYTGRSPLEALSIGVALKDTDVAIRCNLVSITEDAASYEEQVIYDHSASEISTEDAAVLLDAVRKELETDEFKFYVGTSYRHLLIWDNGQVVPLRGPHDVPGQVIAPYLPKEKKLRELMEKSFSILKDHPINIERKKQGLHPANSIWFWGAGTKPMLTSFEGKRHKTGVMISAVDLLKGIAVGTGLKNISVEGANGGLHTNYAGKAQAALDALLKEGYDFAYIHIEAPDEMGHQGSLPKKIQAIENIDELVIAKIKEVMDASGEDYKILFLPDHPTPICIRTHSGNPVPYMIYDSTKVQDGCDRYNEKTGASTGIFRASGPELMDHFFS